MGPGKKTRVLFKNLPDDNLVTLVCVFTIWLATYSIVYTISIWPQLDISPCSHQQIDRGNIPKYVLGQNLIIVLVLTVLYVRWLL